MQSNAKHDGGTFCSELAKVRIGIKYFNIYWLETLQHGSLLKQRKHSKELIYTFIYTLQDLIFFTSKQLLFIRFREKWPEELWRYASTKFWPFWHLTFNQWTNGPRDQRTNGPMINCTIGPLFHWSIGPLVHWSLGPLVPWSIGLSVYSTIALLVKAH